MEVIYFPKQRLIILSMLLLARRWPNSRQVQAPFPAASGHCPQSPVPRPLTRKDPSLFRTHHIQHGEALSKHLLIKE